MNNFWKKRVVPSVKTKTIKHKCVHFIPNLQAMPHAAPDCMDQINFPFADIEQYCTTPSEKPTEYQREELQMWRSKHILLYSIFRKKGG